jgi:phosphoribosylaminoimidazole carboxylase PurE protein
MAKGRKVPARRTARPGGAKAPVNAKGRAAKGKGRRPKPAAKSAAKSAAGSRGAIRVAILMGSESDREVMQKAADVLDALGVTSEMRVLSAHRNPDGLAEYVGSAKARGIEVFIAGAGMAAHLAGAVAARTILPVIGVPLNASPLDGLDALLATVQMPPGVPVATVAIGAAGAKNAGYLAAQILALEAGAVREALAAARAAGRKGS